MKKRTCVIKIFYVDSMPFCSPYPVVPNSILLRPYATKRNRRRVVGSLILGPGNERIGRSIFLLTLLMILM